MYKHVCLCVCVHMCTLCTGSFSCIDWRAYLDVVPSAHIHSTLFSETGSLAGLTLAG